MASSERSIGGIPESVFNPGTEETFYLRLGEELNWKTTRRTIEIESPDSGYRFDARNQLGVLTLEMQYKTASGLIFPAIDQSALLERSIAYFKDQGSEVQKIFTRWRATDYDDHAAYMRYLEELKKTDIEEKDKQEAAKYTSTGAIIVALGYSEVGEIIEYKPVQRVSRVSWHDLILASFSKPQPPETN